MRAALLALLQNDSDLAALLPGGIYDAAALPDGEISRRSTPAAFDANAELLPCLLVRVATEVPLALLHTRQANISLLLYQRRGTDAILAARARIYALLQNERLSGVRNWQWRWAGDTGDIRDETLDSRLVISRWSAPVDATPVEVIEIIGTITASMRFGAHLSGMYAVAADGYRTDATPLLAEDDSALLTENGIPIYAED